MMRSIRLFALTVACAALLSACAATTIGRVAADPSQYRNREVTISGTVVDSASLLGRGIYRVDDGTGTLWVVSTVGVPREGAQVSVKGRVQDGFDASLLGPLQAKLPPGVSTGVVLIASSHRLK